RPCRWQGPLRSLLSSALSFLPFCRSNTGYINVSGPALLPSCLPSQRRIFVRIQMTHIFIELSTRPVLSRHETSAPPGAPASATCHDLGQALRGGRVAAAFAAHDPVDDGHADARQVAQLHR